MKILRVFPRRTTYTPTDELAFVGEPPLPGMRPEDVAEIHISVVFTWDLQEAERLRQSWQVAYPTARVIGGGPAADYPVPGCFIPGVYVRSGVIFTTRGCNNRCPWCLVPQREGKLRELPIFAGNVIQDNNVLQASSCHWRAVCAMLKGQHNVTFAGGLDARLITDAIADDLRGLRVSQLFLACDTEGALTVLCHALAKLHDFPRRKLRVYVMVGYEGETLEQSEQRLESVWSAGGLPFCQLYQPPDHWIDYGAEWKRLHRTWSRPAAMFTMHKEQA